MVRRSFMYWTAHVLLMLALLSGQSGMVAAYPLADVSVSASVEATPPSTITAVVPPSSLTSDTYWAIETVDPADGAGWFSSLALDADDYLHVSYSYRVGSNWGLRYATFEGAAWITDTVDASGSVGLYNALTLDGSAQPHISYFDQTNTALKYAYWYRGSWSTVTVDDSADVGMYTSIAYSSSDGNIHISYADETNGALKYARWNGTAWSYDMVDDSGADVGTHTSLALYGVIPRIVYRNAANNSLKRASYRTGSPPSWAISQINASGDGGESTSMVMAPGGLERISYSNGSQGVRYLYRESGSVWHDELVVADNGEFIPTALALDADGYPHIAYVAYVGSEHLLRYAAFNGSTWDIVTVDDSGEVGADSISLAIDGEGVPHIIYADGTHGLRHAWLAPTPDLIVTDIWEVEGEVRCQVQNVGEGLAPAGHIAQLHVDGVGRGSVVIPGALASGERYNAVIPDYAYSCSGMQDTVRLAADYTAVVVEADETNNVREEIWDCDTTAPQIISGPAATSVTTDSAVIQWNTDENSDSWVYYDATASGYGTPEFDEGTVTAHEIALTGLEPGTLYRYLVESNDLTGNRVTSEEFFFETLAPPSEPITGTLSITRREGRYPVYDFTVVVSDTNRLASGGKPSPSAAVFSLADRVIGTSYVAQPGTGGSTVYTLAIYPGVQGFTRQDFFVPAQAMARVRLPDRVEIEVHEAFTPPWEERPIEVSLMTPWEGASYTGDDTGHLPAGYDIQIFVEAMEYEWECEWITFRDMDPLAMPPNCNDVARQVGRVDIYVDNVLVHTTNTPWNAYIYKFDYNAGGLAAGAHTVKVVAVASDDPTHQVSFERTFWVEAGSHNLNVQRTVTQDGSFFDVELEISLAANANSPVLIDYIEDYVREFMPAPVELPLYTVSVDRYPIYSGAGARTGRVLIDLTGENGWRHLAPGTSFTVNYQVVPILHEDGVADPKIGHLDTRVHYFKSGQPLNTEFRRTWFSAAAVQSAVSASDYIIATNPSRLKAMYNDNDVYQLYGSMARLALVRNGVLGFMDTYDTSVLDSLLNLGGYWSESLHPNFRQTSGNHAYVLIVGESEVVPAFSNYNYDICWSIPGSTFSCSKSDNDVHYHDQWYSSIEAPGNPELNLGRIIGNSAAQLRIPIETSIGVSQGWPGYNYAVPGKALVVAESDADGFWASAQSIQNLLSAQGWDAVPLKLPDQNPANVLHALLDDGWSVIHLRGHGSPGSWGRSSLSAGSPVDLGDYAPFVFGTTCLTGNYEGNSDNSLAEKLLQWGASVYIGATQVSPGSVNSGYSNWFYEHDWNPESGEAIGRAFAQLERDKYKKPGLLGLDYDWGRFWVVEYNLYGDPKFGASAPTVAAQLAPMVMSAPMTTLHVQVPAYVVTSTVDGFDAVAIPGGGMLLEGGLPQVPYWSVTLDYAPGYRVQDVSLTARAGQALTTGLTLPVTEMVPASGLQLTSGQLAPLPRVEDDDWFPSLDKVYDWHVVQNPDGSSELIIDLFPFHYQPATTNVEWHDDFTFAIEVISTSVSIDYFALDGASHALGEEVAAEMWLDNSGVAQDVIVAATVRDAVSEDVVVDGLALRALHDAEGISYYAFAWDSSGLASGQYVLWVDVFDVDGNLLDSTGRTFRLGAPAAEITAFSATPGLFQPGDPIATSLTLHNSGSVTITGEAIIQVQTGSGLTVTQTFTHAVTALAPDATVVLNDLWDTTDAAEAEYRIIGYLKYDARTTEIETVYVATRAYVYLPLVLRQ